MPMGISFTCYISEGATLGHIVSGTGQVAIVPEDDLPGLLRDLSCGPPGRRYRTRVLEEWFSRLTGPKPALRLVSG